MEGNAHPVLPINIVSSILLLLGVFVSLAYWSRKGKLSEAKLTIAFFGMIGAFVGAKLGFIVAELVAWRDDPFFWGRMLAGKTILGGLLGGWIGVELAKAAVGERQWTGDDFAAIIPAGISLGRLGCLNHGCCSGRLLIEVLPNHVAEFLGEFGLLRWPAPVVEIAFQMSFLAYFVATRNSTWAKYQQFHIYLMTYGIFRTLHEYFRSTVRFSGSAYSPYMVLGIITAVSGAVAFCHRRKKLRTK